MNHTLSDRPNTQLGLLHIANAFYLLNFSLIVKFADLPLGIQQSVLKEKIRSAVVRKVEQSSSQPLTSLTNDKCKKIFITVLPYLVWLLRKVLFVSRLSKIFIAFFREDGSFFKKAALESDLGPMQHGNVKKRNCHIGSFAAATKDDVVDFLVDLGKKKVNHMLLTLFGSGLRSL